MVDWQDTETGTILYAKDEIPKAKNPLTKTMLKVIRLEAEKNSLIQQMISFMCASQSARRTLPGGNRAPDSVLEVVGLSW